MNARRRIQREPARGFTLIELLIVMVIIGILVALTIPLVADVLGTSREAATKTTLKKINELLQKRLDAFNRDFPKWFKRKYGRDFRPANASDVKLRKHTFRRMFLLNPRTSLANNALFNGQPNVHNASDVADSAEVLFQLLTREETFGTAAQDASEFIGGEVADTDGDGRMEFVDSWGRPLRYYLYPTRLFRPNGYIALASPPVMPPDYLANYERAKYLYGASMPPATEPPHEPGGPQQFTLFEDPDDQWGVLPGTVDPGTFEQTYHHTLATYHTPLVVSAGPDGLLGLYEPFDRQNFGHLARPKIGSETELYDNLTNYNSKAGAD